MMNVDWSFYNWWHNVYRAEAQEYIGLAHWVAFREWQKENQTMLEVQNDN